MHGGFRRRAALIASVLAAAAFAGGAFAASKDSGPHQWQTFMNDVAKRLNVSPTQLRSALQGAFLDRLDALVAAGKLTKAQADQFKQRAQQDPNFPLGFGRLGGGGGGGGRGGPGFGPGFGPGPGRGLMGRGELMSAAAKYLSLSSQQLMSQLGSGKSLAQVASAQHKSTTGLEQALTAALKTRLDAAVAAKRLTSAQEQKLLSRLSARLDQLINRQGPRFGPPGPAAGEFGAGGPGTPY